MKSKSNLTIFLLIPLAAGALSSLLSGTMNMSQFVAAPLTPPSFVFPIVWTILYVLMGLSSYLIYTSGAPSKNNALTTYFIQLFFNFFWSILFFGFSQYTIALIWLIILDILILIMIYQFYKIEPIAAYLMIPYLIWCLFATYLTFMVVQLN